MSIKLYKILVFFPLVFNFGVVLGNVFELWPGFELCVAKASLLISNCCFYFPSV